MEDHPVADESSETDPLAELASIARELRAYVAWQADSGATGLPRDPQLPEKLKRLAEEQAALRAHSLADHANAAHGSENRSSNAAGQSRQLNEATHQPSPSFGATQGAAAQQHSGQASPGAQTNSPSAVVENPPYVAERVQKAPRPVSPKRAPRPALTHLGATLDELKAHVSQCRLCSLHQGRTQPVMSRGSAKSGLCFVGDAPGLEEDAQGEPFVGPAGQLLDRMIMAMGFEIDDVYICNVVKCHPAQERKAVSADIQACSPFLQRQLELLQPQVIVALGGTAVEGLLGIKQSITRLRGKFRLYQGRIAVMPTFHPAYLLHNPSAKKDVWNDLREVVHHMGRELPNK